MKRERGTDDYGRANSEYARPIPKGDDRCVSARTGAFQQPKSWGSGHGQLVMRNEHSRYVGTSANRTCFDEVLAWSSIEVGCD
jgi:hypothetical protein